MEEEYVRAAPGGAGGVKSITNYAPVSTETPLSFKDGERQQVIYKPMCCRF